MFDRHDAPPPTAALPSTAEGPARVRAANTVVEHGTPAPSPLGALGQTGRGGRSTAQGCQGVTTPLLAPTLGAHRADGAPRSIWVPRAAMGPMGHRLAALPCSRSLGLQRIPCRAGQVPGHARGSIIKVDRTA